MGWGVGDVDPGSKVSEDRKQMESGIQEEGWALNSRRGLVQCNLGVSTPTKTLQTLSLPASSGCWPTLLVMCPFTCKGNKHVL